MNELPSVGHLPAYLHSFRSCTGDMGTEMGLCDFKVSATEAQCLLPEWRSDAGIALDVGGGDAVPQYESTEIMPNAFPVAGMQHVIDNATKE
eukprot:14573466-Alexandrium_andersonii.AAC.1